MKKVGLLTTLLIVSLLLTGCFNKIENIESKIIDDCSIDGNCVVEVDESVAEEVKPIEVLGVTEYYLDIEYQIKSGDNYLMQNYNINPTKDPVYFNSFNEENVRIGKVDGNVLLTGYLENKMVPEGYFYETREEMDNAPKVENRYIKYYSDGDENQKILNLGYKRENVLPWRESDETGEGDAIIAIGSRFFPSRIDSISHFPGEELPGEMYGNNLHHFVNDGKAHTFRLEIAWPPFEGEWSYAESVIKNWEILD